MSEKIIVPVLGESITEATVAKWIKKVGDAVEADEPIVELETDKVNLEVPSPVTGILEEINVKDGATIEVGTTLGSVKENDLIETKHTIKKIQPKEEVPSATEKIIEEAEEYSKNDNDVISTKFLNENKSIVKEEPVILKDEEKPLILTDEVVDEEVITSNGSLSPAVRKIVNENNIDVKKIKGSGKEGRILKGDLINLMNITLTRLEKISLNKPKVSKVGRYALKFEFSEGCNSGIFTFERLYRLCNEENPDDGKPYVHGAW